MTAVCPIGFDVDSLRAQVRETYDGVARAPHGDFHFHRGPDYAERYLGYDRTELNELPEACTARFAGVGKEIARVLQPGGRLFLADVVLKRELTLDARERPELWAACIGGALVERELGALAAEAGLRGGRVVQRFNCFHGTSAEHKVAKDLFVHSVNFFAHK